MPELLRRIPGTEIETIGFDHDYLHVVKAPSVFGNDVVFEFASKLRLVNKDIVEPYCHLQQEAEESCGERIWAATLVLYKKFCLADS